MNGRGAVLLGRQEPTTRWPVEEPDLHIFDEVLDFAVSVGYSVDPWQRVCLKVIFAVQPDLLPAFFEVLVIVSRQNGKGTILEIAELAWIFLLGHSLVMHSAHLFETSKEHFTRVEQTIIGSQSLSRNVRTVHRSRGSEEIILTNGARLKFMTRKGGAGRGFTGGKVVLDECMYLDAAMMAAAVPTMATKPEAQIVYTGSAGLSTSTHMASVRRRAVKALAALADGDDEQLAAAEAGDLAMLEWAAERPQYDESGKLIAGDDPADPETHRKANPAYGIRISAGTVGKEAAALGGWSSQQFWTERLGIGEYPDEDSDTWTLVTETEWRACSVRFMAGTWDPRLLRKCVAVAGYPQGGLSSIAVAVRREDGRAHVELVERRRGTAWLTERVEAIVDKDDVLRHEPFVVVLKGDITGHVGPELHEAGMVVDNPADTEWAHACQRFVEQVKACQIVHSGLQQGLKRSLAVAAAVSGREGGWRLDVDTVDDSGPIRAVVLALHGLDKFCPAADDVGDVW